MPLPTLLSQRVSNNTFSKREFADAKAGLKVVAAAALQDEVLEPVTCLSVQAADVKQSQRQVLEDTTKIEVDSRPGVVQHGWMLSCCGSALAGVANKDGGPFGSCVVHWPTNRVISCEHNTVLRETNPTRHGEMNAIRVAAERIQQISATSQSNEIRSYDLYTTAEPCPMCRGAISRCKWIRNVYVGVDCSTAADFGFNDTAFYAEVGKVKEWMRNLLLKTNDPLMGPTSRPFKGEFLSIATSLSVAEQTSIHDAGLDQVFLQGSCPILKVGDKLFPSVADPGDDKLFDGGRGPITRCIESACESLQLVHLPKDASVLYVSFKKDWRAELPAMLDEMSLAALCWANVGRIGLVLSSEGEGNDRVELSTSSTVEGLEEGKFIMNIATEECKNVFRTWKKVNGIIY